MQISAHNVNNVSCEVNKLKMSAGSKRHFWTVRITWEQKASRTNESMCFFFDTEDEVNNFIEVLNIAHQAAVNPRKRALVK